MARSSSLPHRQVVQAVGVAVGGRWGGQRGDRSGVRDDAGHGAAVAGQVRSRRGRGGRVDRAGSGPQARDRPGHDRRDRGRHVAHRPDDGSTRWSTRTMADRHGVGKDTVARIWRARKLRPWRVDTFKLSNDPDFEAKLVDVVGLYLDPPERAVVFSFDEKTQCQALDRTQPSLPLKPGRARTMTHDYKRNGTIDLFAALNVGTGEVLHRDPQPHTPTTCWPSSSGSTCTSLATSRSTSCWTTCPPTGPPGGRLARPSPSAPAGICTSRRPSRPG